MKGLIKFKALEKRVKDAAAKGQRVTVGCGPNLEVQVTAAGNAYYRYKGPGADGARTTKNIGAFNELGLADARREAERMRCAAPLFTQKSTAFKAPTFGSVIDAYIEKRQADGVARIPTMRSLRNKLHALDNYQIGKVTAPLVISVIDARGDTEGNAYRCAELVRQALDYAKARGFIQSNPCDGLTKRAVGHYSLPPKTNHKAFAPEKIGEFFTRLNDVPIIPRLAILFLVISCLRLNSAISVRKDWIGKDCIEIPGEYMKTGKDHSFRVPLTDELSAIIEAASGFTTGSPYLFPGVRDRSEHIAKQHLQTPIRTKCHDLCVLHGLRATARTWMAMNGVSELVGEFCLSHVLPASAVERAYNRYDYLEERREVISRWGKYVFGQLPEGYLEP